MVSVVYARVQLLSCRSMYLCDVVLDLRVKKYLETFGNKLVLHVALKVLKKCKRNELQKRDLCVMWHKLYHDGLCV